MFLELLKELSIAQEKYGKLSDEKVKKTLKYFYLPKINKIYELLNNAETLSQENPVKNKQILENIIWDVKKEASDLYRDVCYIIENKEHFESASSSAKSLLRFLQDSLSVFVAECDELLIMFNEEDDYYRSLWEDLSLVKEILDDDIGYLKYKLRDIEIVIKRFLR